MTVSIVAAPSNQSYSWIGERIRNTSQTVDSTKTATPEEQLYASNNPEVFYYWKPISLDLSIPEFKSVFYTDGGNN